MLLVDVPMPPRCLVCPCSYVIQTGDQEGKLMCNALEWKDVVRAAEMPLSFREEWLLEWGENSRPEKCPIVGETEKGPSERQP